jgi:hypothetical protein
LRLQETGVSNLRLLTAGQMPLDPLTLLMSPNLPRLVAYLCEQADVVIFDAPPAIAVTDAVVLAPHCDVTVFVVAHGMTTHAQFEQAQSVFQEHPEFNVLGVVYNQVKQYSQGAYYYQKRSVSLRGIEGLWERLGLPRLNALLRKDGSGEWVTLSKAASVLGITKAMARRWARTGRLPVVKNGLRRLVRQRDLQDLVDKGAAPSSRVEPEEDALPEAALGREPERVPQIPWSGER